jgi:hypothetical protein
MYIIPANVNNGKLIFNIFLPIDLIIATSGVIVTILMLLIVSPDNLFGAIICLLPGLICTGLVIPVPNYHNIRTVIKLAWEFYTTRQKYIWRGWCYKDGEETSKK